MAITRVGSESNGDISDIGATSISWSHTVPSGASLLLVVFTMQADEAISGTPTWDGDNLTLIRDTGSGTGGQHRTYVYGFINPAAKTATIAANFAAGLDFCGAGGINYAGTVTSSVAAAAIYRQEDRNDSNTDTQVFTSEGSSGNGLFAFGGWRGGDADPFSLSGSFTEIWDRGTGTSTTADTAHYAGELLSGLPSALTVTASVSDQNAGVLVELIAASAGGVVPPPYVIGMMQGGCHV